MNPGAVHNHRYDELAEITRGSNGWGEVAGGVAVSSFGGDGRYPVYAFTNECGCVLSIQIDFDDDGYDGEEDDLCL